MSTPASAKVSQRAGFALRYKVDWLADLTALFRSRSKRQTHPNESGLHQRLKDEQREVERFREKHAIEKIPRFLDPLAAAEHYCEPGDYWFYEYTHKYVHGSDIAMAHSTVKVNGGPDMNIHGRSDDLRLLVIIATFASRSLVLASEAMFKMMGWRDYERFGKTQGKLQPIIDRIESTAETHPAA